MCGGGGGERPQRVNAHNGTPAPAPLPPSPLVITCPRTAQTGRPGARGRPRRGWRRGRRRRREARGARGRNGWRRAPPASRTNRRRPRVKGWGGVGGPAAAAAPSVLLPPHSHLQRRPFIKPARVRRPIPQPHPDGGRAGGAGLGLGRERGPRGGAPRVQSGGRGAGAGGGSGGCVRGLARRLLLRRGRGRLFGRRRLARRVRCPVCVERRPVLGILLIPQRPIRVARRGCGACGREGGAVLGQGCFQPARRARRIDRALRRGQQHGARAGAGHEGHVGKGARFEGGREGKRVGARHVAAPAHALGRRAPAHGRVQQDRVAKC